MKRTVFSTKSVNKIAKDIDDGFIFKSIDNPFWEGKIGLRKEDSSFSMTQEELDEYIKCKLNVEHFANNYCKVKKEDGKYDIINLRDYQYDIINMFEENQFNILLASRQIGKCVTFNTEIIVENDGTLEKVRIGKLYYDILKEKRGLTFLEKLKIKLYDILFWFEK